MTIVLAASLFPDAAAVFRAYGLLKCLQRMAPSSPLRQLLENRVSQLLDEAERVSADLRSRARREAADELNQTARRLRQAGDIDSLVGTLAASAAPYATATLLFRVVGDEARSEKIDLPLASAPALGAAAQSHDPVTAAAVPSEVSQALVDLLGHAPEEKVSILPVIVRERAAALVYCWGDVQLAPLELLVQVAAAVWTALLPAAPLIGIAPAAAPVDGKAAAPAEGWDALSSEDQRIHLRAQRFARVKAAELRLREAAAVQAARSRGNIYEALRDPIDKARESFRSEFFTPCPTMVDYLHLELVRTLAGDDAELLGKDYPGPMV